MKIQAQRVLVIFLILFSSYCYSQADLSINFLMYDNAAPPYNGSWELKFGLDSTATDGIDEHLGEFPVPPDGCCGLGGPILCAAFVLPSNTNAVWKDYRFGELPYSGIKEHRISYCSHPSSTEVTIQCSLPEGVSAVLQDNITGTLLYIEMVDSNQYIIPDNRIGMDLKLTVIYDNVLPVELTSFTASLYNSSIQLNWITATETNNSGFEIERRHTSTSLSMTNWEKIGFVSGFGTTTEIKSYSFTDENVSSGIYKYRLKQIDYDGTFKYSDEVDIEVNLLPKEFVLEQNYPNPFNPTTNIKFSIPIQTKLKLNLYNVIGELVQTIAEGFYEPGNYDVTLNANDLPSGIYFYRLESNETLQSKKLILIK